MKAHEFLTLADSICNQGPAGARSATSRAYYGVFHLALAALSETGVVISENSNSHSNAAQCLQNVPSENAKNAGSLLGILHGSRVQADYRLKTLDADNLTVAKLAIAQARRIESFLMQFRKELETNRDAIRNALVSYCRMRGVKFTAP